MNKKIVAAALVTMVSFGATLRMFPAEKADAALAFLYDKKNPNRILTTKKAKYIYVGGKTLNVDYSIGGKKKGIKGTWTSSNPAVIAVSKTGKLTALDNGTATVSFSYKSGMTTNEIKCLIKSKTRAVAAKVLPSAEFDGNMNTDSILNFSSELTTNPKAVAVKPDIKTTYKAFYELFIDENCEKPAPSSLATVSEKGMLVSKSEVGKVYLRVSARNSLNSKSYAVNSSPVAININGRVSIKQIGTDKFEVKSEGTDNIELAILKDKTGANVPVTSTLSDDKKTLVVVAGKALTEPHTVTVKTSKNSNDYTINFEALQVKEIKLSGMQASLATLSGNKITAEIGYRLLDQFGNDVTNDLRFAGKTYAFWEGNTRATVTSDGKISIPLTAGQLIGYEGKLEVTYGGEVVVSKSERIKIGNPSVVKELSIMGVYKREKNGFTKVMDAGTYLPVGTIINHYGGVSTLHTVPESYFLLIKAKDSNGNTIADAGLDEKNFAVTIKTETGIELDTADGKPGVRSISPIQIDGVNYLTYPLKPAVLKAGNVLITVTAPGTKITNSMATGVSDKSSAGIFVISGEGKVGVDNVVNFILYNSNKTPVTKYEEVLSTLGFNDYGSGSFPVPLDSPVIHSENSSIFIFRKNKENGQAELVYKPNALSVPNGMTQNKEEITVLKGTEGENKYYLTVKLK